MSFLSTVVADLKFAIAHPATARKELIATASTVAADVAFFTQFSHASGLVATGATAITAACTFVLTVMGTNADPADVKPANPVAAPAAADVKADPEK